MVRACTHLSIVLSVLLLAAAWGCERPRPRAGRITEANARRLLLSGPVAHGAVGDYYLENDHLIAIVERPNRSFGPGPYGGNVIDLGRTTDRQDLLGETLPVLQFGLTAEFTDVHVIADGSDGGPAVLEAIGKDALWDFINIQTAVPLLEYTETGGRPSGLVKFDPHKDLPLEFRARYTLAPDARHVEVRYYVTTEGDETLEVLVALGLDVRTETESFALGRGFTEPGANFEDIGNLLNSPFDTPFFAYQGDTAALGMVSRDYLDGTKLPRISVGVIGMGIVMLGAETLLDVFENRHPLVIEPGRWSGFGLDLFVGDDVADVRAWAEDGTSNPGWGTLAGRVVDASSGAPVVGARVAAIDPDNGDVLDAFVTDGQGRFGAPIPAGRYHVAADDLARDADPGRAVIVEAGAQTDVEISLASPGAVHVQVSLADDPDSQTTKAGPCRIALFGPGPVRNGGVCGVTASCDNPPFRHGDRVEVGPPVPYVEHLVACDSVSGRDRPLSVVPGRYVAVVSRGPEYDYLAQLIDVPTAASVTVSGVIHRVVDSAGYAASEFHVHQVHSTDSIVPYHTRTASFAAAGVDFFATTDHDAVTDLRPVIADLGLSAWLSAVPGVEVSTIDLGHFNGFPIEPIAGMQGGAPPDWAGRRNRPTPAQLFERMRARGAKIVQANHPRMRAAYFDRTRPIYDFERGTIVANREIAPSPRLLMMPPDVELFSPTFDAMELYNGRRGHEEVMRDWFNFISMGFVPTGTGVSDTHAARSQSPGEPRTYVRVEPGAGPPNPDDVLDNLARGRAVVSSGPVLDVTLSAGGASAGLGEVLTAAAGPLEVRVVVQTPAWYEVTCVEVFANHTYADPLADASQSRVDGCGRSSREPVSRWSGVLSGEAVVHPNGGTGLRYEFTMTLSEADLIEAFANDDAWFVVRARGPRSGLYPVGFSSGWVTIDPEATTAEGFAAFAGGRQPFALTNPIFVDRDGNGRYDPPYPLQ